MSQETYKKYIILENETLEHNGRILYRIQALKDFADVKAGDKGGWIEKEENLSQKCECWIYDEAKVFDNAMVYGNAKIRDESFVCGNANVNQYVTIYERAGILEHATVLEGACVFGDARVYGKSCIYGASCVYGNSKVYGSAQIYGNTQIYGNAKVSENSEIFDNAKIYGNTIIFEHACVMDNAQIYGNTTICGHVKFYDDVHISGNVRISENISICGDAVIEKPSDYKVFKNTWSSGRSENYFIYTKSKKIWKVDCFGGTGDELIKYGYQESELSGRMYETCVKFVREQEKFEEEFSKSKIQVSSCLPQKLFTQLYNIKLKDDNFSNNKQTKYNHDTRNGQKIYHS